MEKTTKTTKPTKPTKPTKLQRLQSKLEKLQAEYKENNETMDWELKQNGFTDRFKRLQDVEQSLYRRISICKIDIDIKMGEE